MTKQTPYNIFAKTRGHPFVLVWLRVCSALLCVVSSCSVLCAPKWFPYMLLTVSKTVCNWFAQCPYWEHYIHAKYKLYINMLIETFWYVKIYQKLIHSKTRQDKTKWGSVQKYKVFPAWFWKLLNNFWWCLYNGYITMHVTMLRIKLCYALRWNTFIWHIFTNQNNYIWILKQNKFYSAMCYTLQYDTRHRQY